MVVSRVGPAGAMARDQRGSRISGLVAASVPVRRAGSCGNDGVDRQIHLSHDACVVCAEFLSAWPEFYAPDLEPTSGGIDPMTGRIWMIPTILGFDNRMIRRSRSANLRRSRSAN